MLTTLLAAALVLGVLILVHELGHFLAAKAVDIRVPRFSIGLGPKMTGFRRGETEYVISWLPLGGYVKMAGMGEEEALSGLEGEAEEGSGEGTREPSARDFDAKPLWARTMVISAGVAMNFLFAVAAFAAIAWVWGVPEDVEPRVGEVVEEALPGEAVSLARLQRGNRVDSVNGEAVRTLNELQRSLLLTGAGEVRLTLDDGRSVTFAMPESDSARAAVAAALVPPYEAAPVIGEVREGSPADSAGLRPGDRIVAVNGDSAGSWQAFKQVLERRPGERVELTVRRDGPQVRLTVVPETHELAGPRDTLRYGRIGASLDSAEFASRTGGGGAAGGRRGAGPISGTGYGLSQTWHWTALTVEIAVKLVTGDVPGSSLAGPVRIVKYSGEVARVGGLALLRFMAILSVNLAILNLLPIPVLDGGHLLFLGVEAVRGRAVSPETRIRWTQVGMLLVLALLVWAIGNDILQIFGG